MTYHFEKITILIVEDSKPMMEILKSLLHTFGVKNILTATDGAKGYDLFRQHNPDLVIADWMMDPVDGIKMCEWVRTRNDSPNRFVPFILMTGYSERKRVFKARDTGITEFLVKPFKAQDLYKRIYQVIERPRQFVDAGNFFGPDRRRTATTYTGPDRRGQRATETKALQKSPLPFSADDIDFA